MNIFRILCCSFFGIGSFPILKIRICRLLKARGHDYIITKKAEILTAAVLGIAGAMIGYFTEGVIAPILSICLLFICSIVFLTDWYYRIIPNETVLAVLGLRIVIGILSKVGFPILPPSKAVFSVVGFFACFLIFSLPGRMGKNVGAGDIKLAAAMGFLLGLEYSLLAVVIMGLLVMGFTVIQRKMPLLQFLKSNIPMGPFITVGMFAAYIGAGYLIG